MTCLIETPRSNLQQSITHLLQLLNLYWAKHADVCIVLQKTIRVILYTQLCGELYKLSVAKMLFILLFWIKWNQLILNRETLKQITTLSNRFIVYGFYRNSSIELYISYETSLQCRNYIYAFYTIRATCCNILTLNWHGMC